MQILYITYQKTRVLWDPKSRHFSHVTESRIFKNLNFKKKADRNFRGNFLKNHFRHLKLYSNLPHADWPEVVAIQAPFERQKIEVHIVERANLSGFGTWKFTAKEDFNPQKQVFPFNLRLWPAHKPKIWSFFYGKKFIQENPLVSKLGAFDLKINTFPHLLVVAIGVAQVPCCIYYGLVGKFDQLPIQKVEMGLVVKLQTMQHLANHFSDIFSNHKNIVIGVQLDIELV